MIATIKKPAFEMRGDIPAEFLEITKKYFGSDDVEVIEENDEELIDIRATAWFKKMQKPWT